MLLAFLLRPGDNCIDIGASNDDILRHIVRVAPHGQHIAYEPLPSTAARLAREFPGVRVQACAVADSPGRAPFYQVIEEPALSSLRRLPYHLGFQVERIVVDVVDLDSSLPEGYAPALIKIDAEGAESQILHGAMQTIRAHRPVLVVEFQRDSAGPFETDPQEFHDLVTRGAGMRIFDIYGQGPYGFEEFRKVFHARRMVNFVAHP